VTPEYLKVHLLAVWAAWDEKPGHADRARAMEKASRNLATEVGLSVNVLRAELQAARRSGLARRDALDRVLAEHPAVAS
jgi:hypothetical protein